MNFIIDIGSRQSGKTTRLVDYVVSRITNGLYATVIVGSHHMCRITDDLIIKKLKTYKKYNKCKKYYTVIAYQSIETLNGTPFIDLQSTMFFYDEFDYYIDSINPEYLTVKGYYCSTPSFRSIDACVDNLKNKILK